MYFALHWTVHWMLCTGCTTHGRVPASPLICALPAAQLGYVSPHFATHYAAVGSDLYSKSEACGRCVRVWCAGQGCASAGSPGVMAQVVNECGGCAPGAVALSSPAFQELAGASTGEHTVRCAGAAAAAQARARARRQPSSNMATCPYRPQVAWEWADCAELVEGGIALTPKDSTSNAYWQAFSFANSKKPLAVVSINGQTLTRTTWGFWEWVPKVRGPGCRAAMHSAHLVRWRSRSAR